MQNHFSLAKEAPCPMKQPSHLHRDLVEATVRRVLAGVRTDPERELRKLVDLGADVSRGRFQRRFLTAAQHLLEDPDSSYYAIARELLSRPTSTALWPSAWPWAMTAAPAAPA